MNRLHPATMIVAFLPKLYDAFRQVLPFLAISFFSGKGDNTELFVAAIGVLGGFGAIAAYITTKYGVEEDNLVYKTGWLFKRDRRIPLDQIQNVNVKQGVLERLLKVATVEVETAAGTGAEMKLQVVTEQAADLLRGELSSRSGAAAVSQEPATEAKPIYRLSKQDLLFGAMTENQGGIIVFGLLGTIGAAAMVQIGFRVFQVKDYIPPWMGWIAGIALAGSIWFLGWLYGGFQYWVKYGGFVVRPEPGMFRISHGLLTKLQFTVRLRRVEMASITTTIWQRMIGRCAVYVGTAGTFGESGTMAPVAMMVPVEHGREILKGVLPGFDDQKLEWKPYPPYYLWVLIVRGFMNLAIFALFLCFAYWATRGIRTFTILPFGPVTFAAIPLAIIVWHLVSTLVSFRKMAYAISPEFVAARSGWLRKSTQYMPVSRIDTVGTVEPVWWRRRGVTKATGNAMVHRVDFGMLPIEDAERIRQLVVERLPRPNGFTMDLSQGADS